MESSIRQVIISLREYHVDLTASAMQPLLIEFRRTFEMKDMGCCASTCGRTKVLMTTFLMYVMSLLRTSFGSILGADVLLCNLERSPVHLSLTLKVFFT